MSAIESLGAEVKRKNGELKDYYNSLYQDDEKFINKEAENYVKDEDLDDEIKDNIKNAFIAGWKHSIMQPHTRMIHLIAMYAYDYIPYFVSVNMKHTVTCIRDIFRNKLYPKELNEK